MLVGGISAFKRSIRVSTLCLLLSVVAAGEQADIGKRIYIDNAQSVLLLYARSSSGEFVAQGSGFLVGDKKIVTNAHVANAGKIFVDLGTARVPAQIQTLDNFNDLAVLTVDAEIAATPLILADTTAAPGDLVFAIGNPEGLQRSISQGVVSGMRQVNGKQLIQITASLSHGSSGGPIFNTSGRVIGVAVGMLDTGQNLNFAVPAELVKRILRGDAPTNASNTPELLDEVESLQKERGQLKYSEDQNSEWQKIKNRTVLLLHKAFSNNNNDIANLLRIAKLAAFDDVDLQKEAAERAVAIRPTPESYLALATALNDKYIFADNTPKQELMARAEVAARKAVMGDPKPSAEMYFRLANILEDRQSFSEAASNFQLALSTKSGNSDWESASLGGLARCADAVGKFDDADGWLKLLQQTGKISAWNWELHAKSLFAAKRYENAGNAYRAAAEISTTYSDWCNAAQMYNAGSDQESTLSSARKCLELGTGAQDAESDLAMAHRAIAQILNKRGVYLEALSNAKEATLLEPNNSIAFDDMAEALIGLRRFQEAANAAQQAIRLSDGKYGFMHFRLGSAYFEMENWEFARQSFEKAAELYPSEPAAAYNVAQCLQRLQYYRDAVKWYEEYLRRSPDASDKANVMEIIGILKGRR